MSNKQIKVYINPKNFYNKSEVKQKMNTKIGISNRHVHLTREDLNILFGENYQLTKRNDLDQPGQYASEETVTLKTNRNIKENVRIVGPLRNYTQVEILSQDKEYFGINPPIRNSGELDNSEEITIIGPKGQITKKNICIIANRHIHINIRDKDKFYEDEIVKVKVGDNILDNVHIKISPQYETSFHINKDDAINNNINSDMTGVIIKED